MFITQTLAKYVDNCMILVDWKLPDFTDIQVLTSVSVSTGCLSYGICMAYTSSALPSMMEQGTISSTEAEWMSQLQSYNINIDG